jgi:uncharacterized protein YndB with AHSA1/START domain
MMELDPDLDLVLTRELNAPRDILYKCWTTPEHLIHWFVPAPHKVASCELDVRSGGAFNTTFDMAGTLMENKGVYLEVVPNEKIVFTDTYSVGWRPAAEPFMTAIVTFEDIGGGRTRYTAVARHRNLETAGMHKKMGFHDGWGAATTQLEDYARGVMT